MRDLEQVELSQVGGGRSPCPPGSGSSPMGPMRRGKGNNGFGNGSDAPNTDAPGNSGKTGGGKADSRGDSRGRR